MPIAIVEITSNFVGDFKVGDNLVFNAGLLCKLVEANTDDAFNKLIVLQAGAMTEAALAEIIYRAQSFNKEGVPNISKEDQSAIAGKDIDKFNTIIQVMAKYKILDGLGAGIYEELHRLRKYRNKVHIQADIPIEGVSRDEATAFSNDICGWALELNAGVLTYLSNKLARPPELGNYVAPLIVPTKQIPDDGRTLSS